MNYEEKYKEALERAKKLHDSYNLMHISVDEIEQIFPELAESEDERIRKAIIKSIKEDSSVYEQEVSKEQMLAWLEKQKEASKAIEAMADLERAVTCGNVDNIPKWLQEELNKAFKKGQESSHEDYLRGYANGYKDAEKRYNESVAYHYPEPVPPGVAYKSPQCYTDVLITPNINSGTSTLKAEG